MVAVACAVPASSSFHLVPQHFRSRNLPQLLPSGLHYSSLVDYRSALRLHALRTGSDGGRIGSRESYGSELIRKPSLKELGGSRGEDEDIEAKRDLSEGSEVEEEGGEADEEEEEEEGIDWEDKILEETVPLVGFVRMILHSGRYQSGARLKPEHERTILEKLLPYHPESEKKIGCGIDYITVGYHPDFESSRCLFIVRSDGQLVDFSYWKCIKGLIRMKYPLYAESFILRHFRRRRRMGVY
ncbi:hypothetical protein SAY87_004490 [Trapa incisa]|uniref:Protein DCL, chloroplastic n=1 Tax=Trapa incisa TaxID=236973 RepID=A0AAN7PMJ7_9MYRT|nr:hypothetical protein SAY87_004490 [Trapa incisa]